MSFWKSKNVFVTGSTGFLGFWLTKSLMEKGANVVSFVRDWTPGAPFFVNGLADKVTTVRGSLENIENIERSINEYEIDTVFHLAAQAIVSIANRNPLSTFETNIKGTWNLLEACRRTGSIQRVVVASSDKAYGDHSRLPYDETFSLRGAHPYDVSKSCADLISLTYYNTYGLPVSITRCGNLFGPGDLNFTRIVPGTFKSVLEGTIPVIRSDGSPKRDYVFVGDIVSAYLTLAEQMDRPEICGQAFNFGVGEPLSVLELINIMLEVAGCPDVKPTILNEAKGEISHQYLDSERAARELGWKAGNSLKNRLKETFDWYQSYLADSY